VPHLPAPSVRQNLAVVTRLMVKQSAPDWLRDYIDENPLFHCTEVGVLYLVVLDAYTKGLPSGAGSKDSRGFPTEGHETNGKKCQFAD
jgi:hypothetical protein